MRPRDLRVLFQMPEGDVDAFFGAGGACKRAMPTAQRLATAITDLETLEGDAQGLEGCSCRCPECCR